MKITNKDLLITRYQNGGINVSTILENNKVYNITYYFYTIAEAKNKFKKTVKEMNI